jgi:DNA-binding transcriptional regulator GbsR (MarR family)
MLRGALMEEPGNDAERYAQARMAEMHGLIDLVTSWFSDIQKLDVETLEKLMKLGAQVQKFLLFTQKLPFIGQDAARKEE